MKEYRVGWVKCPTAYNDKRVLFVEAENEDDAKKVARDHIERKFGIGDWIKFEVSEAVAPPAGKVIER